MAQHRNELTDDDAKLLLRRALELQDEAERKASRTLAAPSGEPGLSLDHLTQAAEGAGIHPDFVLMALAEQQLSDAPEIGRDRRRARWLRATVSEVDSIEVSRMIHGSSESVVTAMKAVAAQPAFNLLLENTVGMADGHSSQIFVFRLRDGPSPFNSKLSFADVRVLLVSVRVVQDDTHVRIRAPLFRRGINLGVAGITATLGGIGGSWSGWSLAAVAAGALGLGTGAALLIPAGIGALAGGALGLGGFRSLYTSLVRQGEGTINAFLTSIAVQVESNRGGLRPEIGNNVGE